MRVEINEMDRLLVPNIIIGVVMLLLGVLGDKIAQSAQINVAQGFGIMQGLWCILWGLYITWQLFYIKYYGE